MRGSHHLGRARVAYMITIHQVLTFAPQAAARFLLDLGASPNARNFAGMVRNASLSLAEPHAPQTPLHSAVLYNHEPIVELLLREGARTDIATKHGTAPRWVRFAVCCVCMWSASESAECRLL